MTDAGIFSNPVFIANQRIVGPVKELIHIGSISMGLNTIGTPYISGSLILKILGPSVISVSYTHLHGVAVALIPEDIYGSLDGERLIAFAQTLKN